MLNRGVKEGGTFNPLMTVMELRVVRARGHVVRLSSVVSQGALLTEL